MTDHHRRARVLTEPEPSHPRGEREARIMAMSALFSAVSYTHHEIHSRLRAEAEILTAENHAYITTRLTPDVDDRLVLAIARFEFRIACLGMQTHDAAARIVAAAVRGYTQRPALLADKTLVAIDVERHAAEQWAGASVPSSIPSAA